MPLLVMLFVMVKQTLLNVIMMVEIVAPSFYQMDRKGNMYELTLNKKNHSSMYLGLVVECHEQGDKHPMKIGQKAL